jgi:hypothetical protein
MDFQTINETLIKFAGYTTNRHFDPKTYSHSRFGMVRVDDLAYHHDWRWIDEIVTKIENLGYNVVIEREFVSIKITSDSPKYFEHSIGFKARGLTKLNGLALLCYDFVNNFYLQK